MTAMRSTTLALLLLLSNASWGSEPLAPGDALPSLSGEDQHGVPIELDPAIRTVLISFDMASGKQANQHLAELGEGFLERAGAVYIANVHGMPGIGRFFALRKMRSYPHRIILSEGEHTLDSFPRQDGSITVVRLDGAGRVSEMDFWDPQKTPLQDLLN